MRRAKDWLLAGVVLLIGRGRRPGAEPAEPRIVPPGPPDRRAENVVLVLFLLATLAAAAFIAVYAFDRLSHQTQWLGLALASSFALLSLACLVIGRRLVVTEELTENYPETGSPAAEEEIGRLYEQSGSRFTRKGLLKLAAGGALGMLGLAALTPALSLGPALDVGVLTLTPWRRGRRLVAEDGRPVAAANIENGSFLTAYPEGADRDLIGSPIVVVRIGPGDAGVVAYSKICTHAGCAIALYRKPTFAPTEPKPALVCPCHYSTFDPAANGKVLFGPAGRPLPRLPLEVDRRGNLRAAGNFNGPVGPSWWGVRMRKVTP